MIHSGKAYLPEIRAYEQYFSDKGSFEVCDCATLGQYSLKDFDVAWHFMGLHFRRQVIFTVHEYQSLSCGSFTGTKNLVKRKFNAIPDLRLFQNEQIRSSLNFDDEVKYCYRNMGVDERFFVQGGKKEYDFVYLGNVSRERGTYKLLDKFKTDILSMKLLVIGEVPAEVYNRYKAAAHITFSGRIDYYEVPKLAARARYGINYMENKRPYSMQTATKLLEYCALGLPVISTSYEWVNRFEKEQDARFYKIDENLNDFDIKAIETFSYKIPDVEAYKWRNIIDRSGVYDILVHAV
jgi:glycosyltransferase involved in cell wall biosynthesis